MGALLPQCIRKETKRVLSGTPGSPQPEGRGLAPSTPSHVMDWSDPHQVAPDEGQAEGQESRPGTHWLHCRPSLGRCWPSGLTPAEQEPQAAKSTEAGPWAEHPEGGTGRFKRARWPLNPSGVGHTSSTQSLGRVGPGT